MINRFLLPVICLFVTARGTEQLNFKDTYWVDWKLNGSEIVFTVKANTLGWIGLGFGPHKNMAEADLVVGGVKHGKGYLYDLHGTAEDTPAADQHEDWHLIEASESDTQTTLKVRRLLDTGDKDDISLKEPVYLLWAFDDQADAIDGKWSYHGDNRGHEKTKRSFV